MSDAEHIKTLLGDAIDSVNALQDRCTALTHALARVWTHYNDTEGASLPTPIADHVAGLLASINKEVPRE